MNNVISMKPKVLLIEDAIELVQAVISVMEKDYEIIHTTKREDVERYVDEVDVVVCDYHFSPHLSFEQVLEIVGDRKPVILNTGDPSKTYKNQIDKSKMLTELKSLIEELRSA